MDMTKKIDLDKSDRFISNWVKVAEVIEKINYSKTRLLLSVLGVSMIIISTETSRKLSVKFINNAYNKFREKYNIPEDEWMFIGRNYTEIETKGK